MAFPSYVGATGQAMAANTSLSVSIPTGSTGDLIVVIVNQGGTATSSVGSGSGWTKLDQQPAPSIYSSSIFWKIADGSDSLTVAFGASVVSNYVALRFSGAIGVVAQSATGLGTTADAPNLDPGLGAQDFMWVAFASWRGTPYTATPPSGYTFRKGQQTGNSSNSSVSASTKTSSAASEDPPAFEAVSTTGTNPWLTWTLAIVPEGGGGTAYTLTASAGSFSLTGQAASLNRGRRLIAEAAAFVLTGQAITLTKGRQIQANAATFSLGGQNVGLRTARKITGEAGSYALTGQSATLKATRTIAAGAGSYTLTGQSALFDISKKLAAQAGTYTLTGRAAGLIYARRIKADAGSFALTGQDARLTFVRTLQAGAGSFSLTGQDVALKYARRMPVEAGSYVLTGMDANLIADQGGNISLSAQGGVFVFTGGEASFRITGWSPVPPTSENWTPVNTTPEAWTPVSRNPTVWS